MIEENTPSNTDQPGLVTAATSCSPWVACKERMPTQDDGTSYGEHQGQVLWLAPFRPMVASWNDKKIQEVNRVTHWMPIAPPPPDPFIQWREKYFLCHPSIDHARKAWDAAREANVRPLAPADTQTPTTQENV